MEALFEMYKTETSIVITKKIINHLASNGIFLDDPRLSKTKQKLKEYNGHLTLEEYTECFESSREIIEKVMNKEMIIPEFEEFTDKITKFYNESIDNDNGNLATYIPQLANIDSSKFGISICTIDGQRFNIGDCKEPFCIQSCCKPINYCIAIEHNTPEIVHKHVGREQSGQRFNAIVFDENNLPHNPLINAGAIMTCSLIERGKNCADRFDNVMKIYQKLSGNKYIGYSNSVYLSERDTADVNHALARIMKARDVFPDNTDINKVLDFYFQCCSIMISTDAFAIIASTLANGGVCPLTNESIFSPETARNCLSIMYSSGMYDYSGEFAFSVGIPAKSGVGGGIYLVVPNVMGICIWSPKLDKFGNSVRGIEICKKIVQVYNFHNFDNINNKINPVNHK
jgi:glutaminase